MGLGLVYTFPSACLYLSFALSIPFGSIKVMISGMKVRTFVFGVVTAFLKIEQKFESKLYKN